MASPAQRLALYACPKAGISRPWPERPLFRGPVAAASLLLSLGLISYRYRVFAPCLVVFFLFSLVLFVVALAALGVAPASCDVSVPTGAPP
jgi:hypothetical protein